MEWNGFWYFHLRVWNRMEIVWNSCFIPNVVCNQENAMKNRLFPLKCKMLLNDYKTKKHQKKKQLHKKCCPLANEV